MARFNNIENLFYKINKNANDFYASLNILLT